MLPTKSVSHMIDFLTDNNCWKYFYTFKILLWIRSMIDYILLLTTKVNHFWWESFILSFGNWPEFFTFKISWNHSYLPINKISKIWFTFIRMEKKTFNQSFLLRFWYNWNISLKNWKRIKQALYAKSKRLW